MIEEAPAPARPRAAVRQLWSERLDRLAASGLSVVAFCRNEGVSTQALYYWKNKLSAGPTAQAESSPRLLPIHLPSPSVAVELVLPTGAVLRLPPGCDLAFVRSLVAALGEAPC
jgi:transposase